jgi:hypothetical protein
MLNSTEDAHTKTMSTFEADEHLGRLWHRNECPKVLNSTEDAYIESMSTFETDEHLRAPGGTAQLKKPKDGVEALEKQLDRILRQKPISERQLKGC